MANSTYSDNERIVKPTFLMQTERGDRSMERAILSQLFSIEGKNSVITGGYRGIGLAIAEAFAEAGANVVLLARNGARCKAEAEKLAKAHGVNGIGKALDVSDSKAVTKVIEEIVNELGRIDILVNCAGVPGSEKPVLKMTDEDLDEVMNIDFRGTFLVSREAARFMAKQKSGKIINISSAMAKVAARNMAGYCASKAAVVQLTRVMALELMKDNIQVNAVCPGYFLTDFNKEFFQSELGQKVIKKMVPLGRVADLEEIKSTALYLATCPAFMTGADLFIDGGHCLV